MGLAEAIMQAVQERCGCRFDEVEKVLGWQFGLAGKWRLDVASGHSKPGCSKRACC